MKARYKDSGEIIELAEEGIIAHDGRRFCWYQVDLIPEPIDEFAPSLLNHTVDWPLFRREAAKDILCALVSVPNKWEEVTYESFAYGAVRQADELIKQLRDGKE